MRTTKDTTVRIASLDRLEPELKPLSLARFWRPRSHLDKKHVWLLAAALVVPLVIVLLRAAALPGFVSFELYPAALRALGHRLNDLFSLSAVPPDLRERILYLLIVPASAVLAALARLTLGIRVLGFRAILISLAIHECGLVPSLILVTSVVLAIVLVRPRLKRLRLPYYARVSIILCIAAGVMLLAILAGPWLMEESVWSVAFFPVIVLGLLAEGVARTLEREGTRSAVWRTFTTLLLAVVIDWICGSLPVRAALLSFPELAVLQIAILFVIAEFFDLRFFQEWDARGSGLAIPHLLSGDNSLRIAIVRNRRNRDIIGRLGRPCPEKYGRRSVQRIIDALRKGGHTVKLFEGDMSLLPELREFMPPNPRTGEPSGIVLNLAYGVQGDARYTHVPAMLEMAGIAYTSANPLGHSLALDKAVAKVLMQHAGVPTPRFCVMVTPDDDIGALSYPLIVKPRHESSSFGLKVVDNRRDLEAAVSEVIENYRQGALVEEFIAGREVNVSLLGNDPVEVLPLVELDFRGDANATFTHDAKFHKAAVDGPDKICPAVLDPRLEEKIRQISVATFLACYCRDYARVDIRISESGEPYVLEINSMATLGASASFVMSAEAAGYTFTELMCRIVEVARARYATGGATQLLGLAPSDEPSSVLAALADAAGVSTVRPAPHLG